LSCRWGISNQRWGAEIPRDPSQFNPCLNPGLILSSNPYPNCESVSTSFARYEMTRYDWQRVVFKIDESDEAEGVAYRGVEARSAVVARESGAVDNLVLTVGACKARLAVTLVAAETNVTTDRFVETWTISCAVIQVYITQINYYYYYYDISMKRAHNSLHAKYSQNVSTLKCQALRITVDYIVCNFYPVLFCLGHHSLSTDILGLYASSPTYLL